MMIQIRSMFALLSGGAYCMQWAMHVPRAVESKRWPYLPAALRRTPSKAKLAPRCRQLASESRFARGRIGQFAHRCKQLASGSRFAALTHRHCARAQIMGRKRTRTIRPCQLFAPGRNPRRSAVLRFRPGARRRGLGNGRGLVAFSGTDRRYFVEFWPGPPSRPRIGEISVSAWCESGLGVMFRLAGCR